MARTAIADGLKRSGRRFRRRGRGFQVSAVVVVLAVVGGLVYAVAGATGSRGTTSLTEGLGATTDLVGVGRASTSTRGIVGNKINVFFPIVDLTTLAVEEGFAGDTEDYQQANAIHTYVNQINANGGIHGRKINPIIVPFDINNEAEMRADCKDWTEGSPPAFAVLDGLGDWIGDNELCITQEGKTPFIGEWSTVTNWTTEGSPYLWWLGPDQAVVLKTLVSWGRGAGLLGHGRKVGIVAGDRASDQIALKDYLLPDFKRLGLPAPVVETLPANLDDAATTDSAAPLVVERLKLAGVTSVIPLIPFNAFFPYLQAETQQEYFPRLLLSDYEYSIEGALGLLPQPYGKALDGQLGITVEDLGGIDDARPVSQGGYNAQTRSCYVTWKQHNTYPSPPAQSSPYIEEQGPIVRWCEVIRLFAAAARRAGPHLNRRTFVEAMAKIRSFPGTISPVLSFGPEKFDGPTEYRVVRLHTNDPKHNACILTFDGIPQGTCWQIVQNWRPLGSG